MGYLERCLIPGEEVRYRAGLHWSTILRPIVVGTFLDLAGLACIIGWALGRDGTTSAAPILLASGVALLLAGGLVLAVASIRLASTQIVVTTRRVLIKSGILQRRTVELLLSKIESVDVTETVSGRMMGYGKVVLRGTGGTPESFDRIANPLEFRRQVQSQVDALTDGRKKIGAS
ncbi:MAG TPA: PH domain-containing protein [Candidatus Eisenbacteria bacterium]|nr:PH domain-containing protein [Candidatus Eisenbacteria bacterium]